MDRKPVSIAEDNTILITAVFAENGALLKGAHRGINWVELDLLVSKDVTLDRFLRSLGIIIGDMLCREHHVESYREAISLAYRSRKELKRSLDTNRLRGEYGIFKRMRDLPYYQAMEENKTSINELECGISSHDGSGKEEPNPIQIHEKEETLARNEWIQAMRVFRECMIAYRGEVADGTPTTERKQGLRGHLGEKTSPRLSFYSLRKSRDNADGMESVTLNHELHGDLTLHELGFDTAAKVIFDPLTTISSRKAAADRYSMVLPPKDEQKLWGDPSSEEITISPTFHFSGRVPRIPKVTPQLIRNRILGGSFFLAFVAGAYFLLRTLVPGGPWEQVEFLAIAGGVTFLLFLLIQFSRKKTDDLSLLEPYEIYIRDQLYSLRKGQEQLVKQANHRYPPVYGAKGPSLIRSLRNREAPERIYDRSDREYLSFIFGTTAKGSQLIQSPIELVWDEKPQELPGVYFTNIKKNSADHFRFYHPTGIQYGMGDRKEYGRRFSELPEAIEKEYAYLTGFPLPCKLRAGQVIGLYHPDPQKDHSAYIDHILMDLCYHHSPKDLQIILFGRPKEDNNDMQDRIRNLKYLPHFRGLFKDRSQFVFSAKSARHCLDRLNLYLSTVPYNSATAPHVLLVMEDSYDFTDHMVSSLILENSSGNCSVILCSSDRERICQQADTTLMFTNKGACHLLYRGEEPSVANGFTPISLASNAGEIPGRELRVAFEILSLYTMNTMKTPEKGAAPDLSALIRRYRGADIGAGKPFPGSLFLHNQRSDGFYRDLRTYIMENWNTCRKEEPGYGMEIPFGFFKGRCCDLHFSSFGDGEHALLTGSPEARSATLQNIVGNLAVHYPPENFMVLSLTPIEDDRWLQYIPNLLTCPYQDEYCDMMQQQLAVLNSTKEELLHRSRLLRDEHLSNIDDYNNLLRSFKEYEGGKAAEEQFAERTWNNHEELPHIFLYVDLQHEALNVTFSDSGHDDVVGLDEFLYTFLHMDSGLGFHLIMGAGDSHEEINQDWKNLLPIRIHAERVEGEESLGESYVAEVIKGSGNRYPGVRFMDLSHTPAVNDEVPCPITLCMKDTLYRTYVPGSRKDLEDEAMERDSGDILSDKPLIVGCRSIRIYREGLRFLSPFRKYGGEKRTRRVRCGEIRSYDSPPKWKEDPIASRYGGGVYVDEQEQCQGLFLATVINRQYFGECMDHML